MKGQLNKHSILTGAETMQDDTAAYVHPKTGF